MPVLFCLYLVSKLFAVFPGSAGEVRASSLVQQLLPDHLRLAGQAGAEVPAQSPSASCLRY